MRLPAILSYKFVFYFNLIHVVYKNTIKTHTSNILNKLGLRGIGEIRIFAKNL